jgi:hypothetical protein
MTESSHILRCFRKLETAIREAVVESKLAYEFNANSYSFSAMDACIAAERALENLREALTEKAQLPPQPLHWPGLTAL